MPSQLLLSISLLLVAMGLQAQTPEEFFHGGAQSYITNNLAKARETVGQGLKLFPDDPKLKKLDELLKQQSQQQSQQDQQKSEPQSGEQKPENKEQKDQPKPGESGEPKEQPEKAEQDAGKKSGQGAEPKGQKAEEPPKDGQMTSQQAKQLLDGQKNDETLLPFSPKEKTADRRRVRKDW